MVQPRRPNSSDIIGKIDKIVPIQWQDIPYLSVSSELRIDPNDKNSGQITPGITFGSNAQEGISSRRTGTVNPTGLDFYTAGTVQVSLDKAGRMGIGTPKPGAKLEIFQGQGATGQALLLTSYGSGPGSGVRLHNVVGETYEIYSGGGDLHVLDANAGLDRLVIDKKGNVGIGSPSPDAKLNIAGDARMNDHQVFLRSGTDVYHGIGWYGVAGRDQKVFAGTTVDGPVVFGYSGGALGSTGGGQKVALSWDSNNNVNVGGNINVKGDVILQGADCAEEFAIENTESVEPGTVMVISANGALAASQKAYDKRVAGVVSGAGDFRPGIVLDSQKKKTGRLPLAMIGKVFCKVDADYGQIEVGDLLTTSPTTGHAMKASDRANAFGTIIGKALSGFTGGKGLIPILVALQ